MAGISVESVQRRILFALAISLLVSACSSRYRLDLYLTCEGQVKKVKVEQAQFLPGWTLDDPYGREKIAPGSSVVLLVETGARWERPDDTRIFMLGFDEYLRARVYIQLPEPPVAETIPLEGHSFVHVLGRYDLAPDAKVFLPDSGSFVVDSVTAKRLYGTLHGLYRNNAGAPFAYDGRFKVKIDR